MVKIAFVIDTIESPTAGTERQLLLLLRSLDRTRFMPYLCVLSSSEWLEKEFNLCPVHVVGIRTFKHPGTYCRIRKFSEFLKNTGIDMVQTYFRDANIAGILAARRAGVRTIIVSKRNQGYWYTGSEIFILRLLNRWVSLFIANSRSTKEWAARLESIPIEKIRVIYNGIELELFGGPAPGSRRRYREELAIPANAPCVGIVANLRPVKGIDIFLKAVSRVLRKIPAARFVIVGEGGERARLQSLSAELGIVGRVLFLGRRSDIPTLLGALDLGVLASHSESSSNALIEYMAAGLPVVTTDVGGARETVEQGVTGYIVPVGDYRALADAVTGVLANKKLMAHMGEMGRKRAAKLFSLEAFIEATEHTYEQCAERRTLSVVRQAQGVEY